MTDITETKKAIPENRNRAISWFVAISCGIGVWVILQQVTPSEPWDHQYYWLFGYPIMILVAGFIGYQSPARAWRWGVVIVMAQALWVLFADSKQATLFPLTVAFFGILSIPPAIASAIAGRIRRSNDDPPLSP